MCKEKIVLEKKVDIKDIIINIKKISILYNILNSLDKKEYKNITNETIINVLFEYLTTQINCILYNLPIVEINDDSSKCDDYLEQKHL